MNLKKRQFLNSKMTRSTELSLYTKQIDNKFENLLLELENFEEMTTSNCNSDFCAVLESSLVEFEKRLFLTQK